MGQITSRFPGDGGALGWFSLLHLCDLRALAPVSEDASGTPSLLPNGTIPATMLAFGAPGPRHWERESFESMQARGYGPGAYRRQGGQRFRTDQE
jgi:hypothetical protein